MNCVSILFRLRDIKEDDVFNSLCLYVHMYVCFQIALKEPYGLTDFDDSYNRKMIDHLLCIYSLRSDYVLENSAKVTD